MKAKRIGTFLSLMLFTPATFALAETGTRHDNSQLLVWAFLGMCALIIIVQLMPVVMIAFGLIKGLLRDKDPSVKAEVTADK